MISPTDQRTRDAEVTNSRLRESLGECRILLRETERRLAACHNDDVVRRGDTRPD